jgi:hypothetical protein
VHRGAGSMREYDQRPTTRQGNRLSLSAELSQILRHSED